MPSLTDGHTDRQTYAYYKMGRVKAISSSYERTSSKDGFVSPEMSCSSICLSGYGEVRATELEEAGEHRTYPYP